MADHVQSHQAAMETHPPGIVVEIVSTLMGKTGHFCEEHAVCGSMLEEGMVVRLRKVQVLVEGCEDTAITCIWVTDGVDRCRAGFLMRHMVKHAMRYDGVLAQVAMVFSGNETECSREERQMYHAKRGYCEATIISCLPEVKSHLLLVDEVREKKEANRGVVVKREQENVMMMGEIEEINAKKQ